VITTTLSVKRTPLSDFGAAERGADGFADRDERVVTGRGGVFADVELDAIRYGQPAPGEYGRRLARGGGGHAAGMERRRERLGDAAFEGIAGDADQLFLDMIERLPLSLADFDREELEQVTIVIRGGRAGSLRAIQEPARHIEADRPRARRRPC